MLRITVSDTGPGLKSSTTDHRLSGVTYDGGEPVSTGVGLANIRERLEQAYSNQHVFETFEPADGGFGVVIEIPVEKRRMAENMPWSRRPRRPSEAQQRPARPFSRAYMTIRTILVDDEKLAIQGLQLRPGKIPRRGNRRYLLQRPRGDPQDQDGKARSGLSGHPDAGFRWLQRGQGRDGDRTTAVRVRHRLSGTRRPRSRPMPSTI